MRDLKETPKLVDSFGGEGFGADGTETFHTLKEKGIPPQIENSRNSEICSLMNSFGAESFGRRTARIAAGGGGEGGRVKRIEGDIRPKLLEFVELIF